VSNNYANIFSLKILLKLGGQKGITNLQVFGDYDCDKLDDKEMQSGKYGSKDSI
jgi:hypothetical protein